MYQCGFRVITLGIVDKGLKKRSVGPLLSYSARLSKFALCLIVGLLLSCMKVTCFFKMMIRQPCKKPQPFKVQCQINLQPIYFISTILKSMKVILFKVRVIAFIYYISEAITIALLVIFNLLKQINPTTLAVEFN